MDKTETVIREKSEIKPEELKENGWKNTGQYFSSYQIWTNKDEGKSLLFIPEKNIVYLLYSLKQ